MSERQTTGEFKKYKIGKLSQEQQCKYIMAMEWLNKNKDIFPFNELLNYISKLQKDNKELNLENQALYESINCNDDNMLARRYEKLQKELDKEKEYNDKLTLIFKEKLGNIEFEVETAWRKFEKLEDLLKE